MGYLVLADRIYDTIYLLTAVGLTPGGSSTVHIYTQTVHRTTQITTNLEECGPCPVFATNYKINKMETLILVIITENSYTDSIKTS